MTMLPRLGFLLLFLAAAAAAGPSLAQGNRARSATAGDVAGGSDYPGLPRFEGSSLIGHQALPFDGFRLPTGPARQNAQFNWEIPDAVEIEGKVSGYVYKLPAGRSTLEIFRNYETALKAAGFATLFSCTTEESCGRGDTIAQQIYAGSHIMSNSGIRSAQAVMYGTEHRYLSAKRSRDGTDAYASLIVAKETAMGDPDKDSVSVVLHIIEPKPMGQSMVLVTADKMASEVSQTGRVALYGIYFDTDSATLKPESNATLDEIAKLLKADPALKLWIVGHTDNVGGYDHNMTLSSRRSKATLDALAQRYGIAAARLHSAGVGFLSPVASNATEEGRAKNRRVELVRE